MMNGHGKSDSPEVPRKSSNNVGQTAAEGREGNGLAKGNLQLQDTSRTPSCNDAPSALERVRQAAGKDKENRLNAFHDLGGLSSMFVQSAILLSLVVLLYGPVLKGMISQWWNDPDYGHGFFVPLFSGFIIWRQRERWLATRSKPSNFGLVVMLGAVGLLVVGSLGAELFTSRFSLVVLLAGMILFLSGWNVLRAVSFPLSFLFLMIPIPVIIYNQITFPLQLLASRLASSFLELVGVPVLRDGNILMLSNYSLEVVEACSGIRSLMSLTALAIAYGYLTEPRRWVRYVLVVLMVPVAIATNAIRITVAGVLAHSFGPAAAEGFLHGFSGWVIFLAALLLMFVSHRILRHMGKGQKEEARA